MCIKHKFIVCPGINLEFLIDKYVVQEHFLQQFGIFQ